MLVILLNKIINKREKQNMINIKPRMYKSIKMEKKSKRNSNIIICMHR